MHDPKVRKHFEIIIVKDETHMHTYVGQEFFLVQVSKKETRTSKTKTVRNENQYWNHAKI